MLQCRTRTPAAWRHRAGPLADTRNCLLHQALGSPSAPRCRPFTSVKLRSRSVAALVSMKRRTRLPPSKVTAWPLASKVVFVALRKVLVKLTVPSKASVTEPPPRIALAISSGSGFDTVPEATSQRAQKSIVTRASEGMTRPSFFILASFGRCGASLVLSASRRVGVPRARAKGVFTDEEVFHLIS
jgi:hypothetical protein